MRRLASFALLALPLLPATARAEPPGPPSAAPGAAAALLESTAPTVATVKFVLRVTFGGAGRDQESNVEANATVVDAGGLVMLSNGHLEPFRGIRGGRRGGGGMDLTGKPSDFRVVFGNDTKDQPAVLVARDTALGLAFVQVVALEGAAPKAAGLSASAPPRVEVGQHLHGVSRLGRGFDYAPKVEWLSLTGKVEKPRQMWSVAGPFAEAGLPLYDAGGRVVGVLAAQEGAAADSGVGFFGVGVAGRTLFLLPLDAVGRSIEAAKKRVPEALEKARAEAKASEATEPTDAPAPGDKPGGPPPAPPQKPENPVPPEEKPPESPKDKAGFAPPPTPDVREYLRRLGEQIGLGRSRPSQPVPAK